MADWQQKPEPGQKLWKENIGSGTVQRIDWEYKLVYVDFHENGGIESFEFDELFGCWTEDYGGTWMLYDI